jgi:hypothetical protein
MVELSGAIDFNVFRDQLRAAGPQTELPVYFAR